MGLASSSAANASALGVSRSGGFVSNAYESSSWSKSDWYNAAESWQQMLSTTQMTPYGLMKTLNEIGDDTSKAIEKNVPKKSDPIVTGKQIGRAHV